VGTSTATGRKRAARSAPLADRRGDARYDDADLERLLDALTGVRDGNFRKRLPVTGDGLLAEIAVVFNEVVERNQHLASELSRVRRVVGREGRLVERLSHGPGEGAWAASVDAANSLVDDLVRPTAEVGRVLAAVAEGDLSQKIDPRIDDQPLRGEFQRMARTVNGMVDQLSLFTSEVTRVAREVGTEGKLGGQAKVRGVSGSWKDLTDSVNTMAGRLTGQVRDIALVTTAVARGDLSRKVTVEVAGEMLELKNTVNTMVDQLSSFADEVTRVAREVGTEGRLGGQADVKGVSGTWKDLTDSVNVMASNLTSQVRDIASVATAVANGDQSQRITVTASGEVAELADTINSMNETLQTFAGEVTRVVREIGTEGSLGGQAQVPGVSGTWKDLTDSVNFMAGNLTGQVRDIALVTTAVAKGDLSQKVTVEVAGEMLELKNTVNTMVDQLSSFADEVTRVAREVGSEGRLGGQAQVTGVAGTWRDLTDSVNFMAGNLTSQVRNIAQVTTAVAKGDLSQKITVAARGEILELKNTINTMVDQLSSFADEVTRVAREVGTEGALGGQAQVMGVAGTWRDLTDSVNFMAGNLTSQVRSIAQVATAVAGGDLSKKIEVDARGEIQELKNTINTMVDQLSSFADEVTRVAREVGTEGRLGGQADVKGVSGTWKDLTENVNLMANNLTSQVRNIAQVTTAVALGDLSQKITVDARGEILQLKETINTMVDQLSAFADEVTRVAREVGTEGILGGQARVRGVSGTWKDLTDSVNVMALNLTSQVRSIATVATAVAGGDLSKKSTVEAKGEVAALADTINTMVDTLRAFADEVTRVAREVGTEGILGGQARVPNVAGTWKDLTDNVNSMANNLTSQVRNIALVTTAVAGGDLSQKIDVDARGEILELKTTINTMVDQLSAFAAEVTRVAREVGTEGILGGQAEVEGVSGTWKRLTESVNQLAGNLTTQVRAIAEVATAVTRGDLTRLITVDALGEVAELKDNVNQMIANLRETTRANEEQDWLKTNLARISGLMQGRRDLQAVAQLIMSELTPVVSAQYGAFFLGEQARRGEVEYRLIASYGYQARKSVPSRFRSGEALVGQAVYEKKPILISPAPADYIRVASGLGEAAPANIVVLPLLFEDQVLGVIELASFTPFSEVHHAFLDQLMETIGVTVNTIIANSRTEALLSESQRLTMELQQRSEELQSQQESLRLSNTELEEKAALLAQQNRAIEIKNNEIEQARRALEERAEQLALSSKYKSEFLANMSHELRTPLNSLLILARLLADNTDRNLTSKQVEFARTIHSAGSDLLQLINDILDLSKVEAGKMDIHPGELPVVQLVDYVEATFRPLTADKGLAFRVTVSADTPAVLHTDEQRLQQILRNLLSNAVKFTESGEVRLHIQPAEGVRFTDPGLAGARAVLGFSVSDTGIGIPDDKLRVIFEAFQQADGTTSRKYGGTGLGLSISREIARLLGGEIRAESAPGRGSTFTLYIPVHMPVPGYAVPQRSDAANGAARPASTPFGGSIGTPAVPAGAAAGNAAAPPAKPTAKPTAREAIEGELAMPEPAHVVSGPPVAPALLAEPGLEDDRANLRLGDRTLLVIVEDPELARKAIDLGRKQGFQVVASLRAQHGLSAAHDLRPNAVLLSLDVTTPDGRPLLDALKRSPDTRHIPICAVDPVGGDGWRRQAVVAGALTVVGPPLTQEALADGLAHTAAFADRRAARLLLAVPERERDRLTELIGAGEDVEMVPAEDVDEAFRALSGSRFDAVLVDVSLPGADRGFALLDRLADDPELSLVPVVVHSSADLDAEEEARLRGYGGRLVIKDGRTAERLLDATALVLHRPEAQLPAERRQLIEQLRGDEKIFVGKKVLIVDDDVRNVFALTSVLEQHGMAVLYAENGREGIETLVQHEDVALVLMDIMMPEMDGYTTTEAIRRMPQFARLPIIALTAKAMKGDREKSIASGASDYVTKPVDLDQLLSLMRMWMHR
jgi:HAMP domain-containing protein/signal transduction histidine kinase/CheY-like chemotaxis protein